MVKLIQESAGGSIDAALVTNIRFLMMAALTAPFLPRGGVFQAPGPANAVGAPEVNPSALGTAALEIGLWQALGTFFNTWGIENTTAIRAALLFSTVNIMTPTLSALFGDTEEDRRVSAQTWFSCFLCFCATLYATSGSGPGDATAGLQSGDVGVLAAAFCFAALKVRIAPKARVFPAEMLAAGRLLVSAVLAITAFAVALAAGEKAEVLDPVSNFSSETWLLLLVSAIVPGVSASILQAKGQKEVPPAQAQVIYAGVPVFAAIFQLLLLKDSVVQDRELVAGAVIVCASLISARNP